MRLRCWVVDEDEDSMHELKIGNGFSLPLGLTVMTQAILARKRSGKSYTASVQAEEMLREKQQIAVIDPTSAWWGLRSSSDGQGEGYPVVVFGGDHADASLDYRSGKAMARALVEHGFSAIFDIGSFETDEQVQFVMDFCSELLRINRNAMHVFMDEADTFAPQQGSKLQVKCRGTVSRLVKQGGIKGVGFTMITQRSASLSWDILSQVDILTILRMSAPHDLNPVKNWLQSETTKDFAAKVYEELPRLPVGVAFVASAPLGIAKRVEIRQRRTFNSGATPKPGERQLVPKVLAAVDIEKLGKEISEAVKRTREESPEFLKQRIRELEVEVAKKGTVDMGAVEEIQRMESELAELRQARAEFDAAKIKLDIVGGMLVDIATQINRARTELQLPSIAIPEPLPPASRPLVAETRFTPTYPTVVRRGIEQPTPDPSVTLRGKSKEMLAVCAGMHPAGLTEAQVAMQSGMKRTSGTFGDYKSLLRTSGCITIGPDGLWYATTEGMRRAGASIAARPTNSKQVLDLWLPKLRGKSKEMLMYLVNHKGSSISYGKLAEDVGMTSASGTFGDYLSLLRTAGLITTQGGMVRANAEALFL